MNVERAITLLVQIIVIVLLVWLVVFVVRAIAYN